MKQKEQAGKSELDTDELSQLPSRRRYLAKEITREKDQESEFLSEAY